MGKWIERVAIAVMVAVIAVVGIGMYTTWRDCNEVGGVTVRGIFGLECIRR